MRTLVILLLAGACVAAQGPGQPTVGSMMNVSSPTAPTGQGAGTLAFISGQVQPDGSQTGWCQYQDARTGLRTKLVYVWWKDSAGVSHMTIELRLGIGPPDNPTQFDSWHMFTWRTAGYWQGQAVMGPGMPWDWPDHPAPPSIRDLTPWP